MNFSLKRPMGPMEPMELKIQTENVGRDTWKSSLSKTFSFFDLHVFLQKLSAIKVNYLLISVADRMNEFE